MTEPREKSPLQIEPEEMRRLGYRVIDLVVDHLAGLESEPAWKMTSREAGEKSLREPPPEEGRSFDSILERLARDVLPYRARVGHPRFLAFVPGSPTYPAILADLLASGFNAFVGTWLGGSGPAMVELVTIDWLREMLGLPEGSGGLFTSGGSSATLVALVAARHARCPDDFSKAVIYASDQTHACVERAARVAGFPAANYRRIPSDASYRMDVEALRSAIAADRRAGLVPFFIVGNAGSTNTGSIDPLPGLARVCGEENAWFHVDAAYGGFAALVPQGRDALKGIEQADSWVLDPHKWLYQPFECGSVLLRRPEELRNAFRVMPDYMQDVDMGGERINFADYSYQLSRSWRALKVWLSVQYFGLARYREAVGRTLDLARLAEDHIRESDDLELLAPATLGIVCFRLTSPGLSEPGLERLNATAQERLNASGYALLSSTRLGGRYSLRFCVLSHETTAADVMGVFRRLRELAG